MGKIYIQLVDLVANALCSLLEQNRSGRISFQKIDEYGAKVVEIFSENQGTKAYLVMSREDQDALFDDYSDFFMLYEDPNGEKGIQLKDSVTEDQLWQRFCLSLSLDVLKVFKSENLRDLLVA